MSKYETFPSPQNAIPIAKEDVDHEFADRLDDETLVTPLDESDPYTETTYTERRTEWREAKQSYQEAKSSYEARLTEYYDQYSEKNLAGRATHKLGEWWNGKPADLEALEVDFKAKRATYAEGLESVLGLRGQAHEQNHEFDPTDTRIRTAFANRFIRRPRQDQLNIEKEHLHTAETVERAERVLQVLKKHKWTTRIGVVAATGLIVGSGAGVAAGIAAGGIKAGRVALGVTGGMAGAAVGNWFGNERVADAETNLADVQADTLASFTVADIDRLERALTDAENTRDAALRARKHKMIAGAIIGGAGLANIDSIADMAVSPAEAAINPRADIYDEYVTNPAADSLLPNQLAEGLLQQTAENDPYGRILEDETPSTSELATDTSETVAPPSETSEAEALAAETREALRETTSTSEAEELAAETLQVLRETAPPTQEGPETDPAPPSEELAADIMRALHEATTPSASPELADDTMEALRETIPVSDYHIEQGDSLWNITHDVYEQQLEDLTEAEQNQVLAGVFDRLRADPALTTELGVKSGNVDLIYQDDVLKMSVLSDLIAEEVERFTTPTPEGVVTVGSGDTLWKLTKEAYGEELASLTKTQQDQVLAGVFDRLRADPALTTELGVKSGNVDLIRPGENLDLSLLSGLIAEETTRFNDGAADVEESPTEMVEETPPDPMVAAAPETVSVEPTLSETDAPTRAVEPEPTVSPHAPAPESAEVPSEYADAETATETTPTKNTETELTPPTPETTLTVTSPEVIATSEALQFSPELSLRILNTFDSAEAFKQAKFETIESLIGPQPPSWLKTERFEPVYEKIRLFDMEILQENNLHTVDELPDTAVSSLLSQLRLIESAENIAALKTWHALYLSQIRPEHPDYLGIPLRENMSFDEFFSEYVVRTRQK